MTDHSDDFLDEDLDISVEPPIDAPGPPVIPPPLVDGQAASRFYRMNKKKSDQDNLNSPSSVFANRTEVDEILTARARNWHELVAELSMLAMGRELQIRSQQPRAGGVSS